MPFCPDCAFEYEKDVQVCPVCRVALVERMPTTGGPAATAPDDSWVRVCKLDDQLTSDMIRGLMDSNNIPSMTISEAFQAPVKHTKTTTGAEKKTAEPEIVMVPREFRQEAQLLLTAILGEGYDIPDSLEQ